jgi:hypothetical protein
MVFLPKVNINQWIEIGWTTCIIPAPKIFLPRVQFVSRLSRPLPTRLLHPLHRPRRLRLRSSPPWPCRSPPAPPPPLPPKRRSPRKWVLLPPAQLLPPFPLGSNDDQLEHACTHVVSARRRSLTASLMPLSVALQHDLTHRLRPTLPPSRALASPVRDALPCCCPREFSRTSRARRR